MTLREEKKVVTLREEKKVMTLREEKKVMTLRDFVLLRKEGLKIDTSITKTRPGPPPALTTAKFIDDLGHISYPDGVTSPKPELNVNSEKGKFM